MAQFVSEYGKTNKPPQPDGRLDAPAFHRNHEAIWSAIGGFLATQSGNLLEIGRGTGPHTGAFSGRGRECERAAAPASRRRRLPEGSGGSTGAGAIFRSLTSRASPHGAPIRVSQACVHPSASISAILIGAGSATATAMHR